MADEQQRRREERLANFVAIAIMGSLFGVAILLLWVL
jgi:hypothetical protein